MSREKTNSNTDMKVLPGNYVLALENSVRLDKKDKRDIDLFNILKPLEGKKRV